MTGDLAAWLRAQLDADEQVARAAGAGAWEADAEGCCIYPADDDTLVAWDGPIETHRDDLAAHIALHDPAFVLADLAAKKKIVGLHRAIPPAYPGAVIGDWPCCEVCSASGEYTGTGKFPCDTLRLLAQPYKGRPGWSDEWSV